MSDFELTLADELPRLVRLCGRFTGNEDAAQDLAQETLIVAWKNQSQLVSSDKLQAWTSAIARNLCLDWMRRHLREQSYTTLSIDAPDQDFDNEFADDLNLELELDRHELALLLDRALSLLPRETGQMLIEHYVQNRSHAEIAQTLKINPGTVAVRLQRGKLTLQKILRKNFQQEFGAFGFFPREDNRWLDTNIWCPWCGASRLSGRYEKDTVFALRCPTCDPEPERIMAGLDLSQPHHAQILGNVKTFKPAYTRLLAAFAPLYQQALRQHTAPCLACGHPVDVTIVGIAAKSEEAHTKQIQLLCPACGWASTKSTNGLMFSLPEVQKFWRDHPRIRTLPLREIESNGALALVSCLQSISDGAELTIILRQDSFDPIQIHSNVGR